MKKFLFIIPLVLTACSFQSKVSSTPEEVTNQSKYKELDRLNINKPYYELLVFEYEGHKYIVKHLDGGGVTHLESCQCKKVLITQKSN